MTVPDTDTISQSTVSSPRSSKESIESRSTQHFQLRNTSSELRDLTPPSSIASSVDLKSAQIPELGETTLHEGFETKTFGKKRTRSGEVKLGQDVSSVREAGHTRNISTLSSSSNGSLAELSESLRTKLNYAMVKVKNGWQNQSIDEVETLATQSPRSLRYQHLDQDMTSLPTIDGALECTVSPSRQSIANQDSCTKNLGSPAQIIPGLRKRSMPKGSLQVQTSHPFSSNRPRVQQRTPSQNAAMEADAVETLLFMSASPNNSGRFPSANSTKSRILSPRNPLLSPEQKLNMIARVLGEFDEDDNEDLDQALSILAAHRASKVSN